MLITYCHLIIQIFVEVNAELPDYTSSSSKLYKYFYLAHVFHSAVFFLSYNLGFLNSCMSLADLSLREIWAAVAPW